MLLCALFSVLVPKYYLWPKIQLHNVEDWNSRVIDTDLAFDWDPDILVYPHLNCEQSSSWCNYTDASDVMIDIQDWIADCCGTVIPFVLPLA